MKKYFSITTRALLITIISIFLLNCKGDDGDPGPKGDKGDKGDTGAMGQPGTNGAPGVNGIGFDESVATGHVVITLHGKRPDTNADFNITEDFKYGPSDLTYSRAVPFADGVDFFFYRFLSNVDDVYQSNYFIMDLTADNNGTLVANNLFLTTFLTTSDHKVIAIDDNYANFFGGVTDYSYDPDSGALKFKFEFTVPAANNSTGSDLSVSGEADVIVYEFI